MSLRTNSQQKAMRGLMGKGTWEQRQANKVAEARATAVVCTLLMILTAAIAWFTQPQVDVKRAAVPAAASAEG